MDVVLTGRLVELRRWRPSDAGDVHRICQDPEIQRWTAVPVPYRPSDAASFVGPVSDDAWSSGEGALFAVVDRAGGALAGSIGVLRFHEGIAAVGYWSAPELRGAGRTTEALRLLTDWCLTARGCVRVELVADPANSASRAVATRAGFRQEGVLRRRLLHRGRHVDVVMYSRLSTDPG